MRWDGAVDRRRFLALGPAALGAGLLGTGLLAACTGPAVPGGSDTDGMMDDLVSAMDKLWSHCNVARLGGYAA